MKILNCSLAIASCLSLLSVGFTIGLANEDGGIVVNKVCPVSGKAVEASCQTSYEGRTYAFCCEKCLAKFREGLEGSLYHRIGGKAAIAAAVDLFYVKVLADGRINFYFEDVNMERQHRRQKAFLGAVLGGPEPWEGKDMRSAHANVPGLNEEHFNAVAENLEATLKELKVGEELRSQVMALVASTKDEVLNRPKVE